VGDDEQRRTITGTTSVSVAGPPTWRTTVSATGRRRGAHEEPGTKPRTRRSTRPARWYRERRRVNAHVRGMERPEYFGHHERPDGVVWGARPSGLGGPCHRSGPLKGLAAATVTKHRNRNTEAQRMPSLGPPTWRTLVSAAGRRGVDDEEPGITPRTWPVPDRRSGHRVRRRARPVVETYNNFTKEVMAYVDSKQV